MMKQLAIAITAMAALACRDDSAVKSVKNPVDACAQAPSLGWIDWALTSADAAEALKGSGGAWISFYKRNYHDALAKFESSDAPHADFAARRTHLRLAILYLELARFQSDAFARYLKARQALGQEASPLKNAEFWRQLANHTIPEQLKNAAGDCKTAPSKTQYGRLLRAYVCGEPMTCGEADAAFKSGAMATREQAYYRAACDADSAADVRELSAEPAASDVIAKSIDGEAIETELAYYDPVALFALAQFHLRHVRSQNDVLRMWADAITGQSGDASPKAKDTEEKWLFSEWTGEAELRTHLAGGRTPPVDKEGLQAQKQQLQAALTCKPDAANAKTITDLKVVPALVDAAARRGAGSPYDDNSCGEALEILRATVDLSAPDTVGYGNEPTFLVRLAAAAMCRGRTSEAIGALRGVKRAMTEAGGALAAAEALSVAKMMGGSNATQRTQ